VLIAFNDLLEAFESLEVSLTWGEGRIGEELNLLGMLHS
jgi:hypothetical protein